jgi:hypothetical protein
MHGKFMGRNGGSEREEEGGRRGRGWFERGNGWCNTELKKEMEIPR